MLNLGTDRFDNVLRRLFNVKGGEVASSLTPEIVPTVQVAPSDPTFAWLRREMLAQGLHADSSPVGNHVQVAFFNPSQGKVVVVERLVIVSDAPGTFRVGFEALPPALLQGGSKQARDVRWLPQAPTLQLFGGVTPTGALLTAGHVEFVKGGAPTATTTVDGPWVLPPGNQPLIITDMAPNTFFRVSAFWFERAVEPSELS